MPTNFVSIQGKVHNFVNRLVGDNQQVSSFSVGFADVGKKATFSFVNVSAWNLPESTVQTLSDGSEHSVLVVGRLKQESWESKGVKKSEVRVVADVLTVVPVRDNPPFKSTEPEEEAPAPAVVSPPKAVARPTQTGPTYNQKAPATPTATKSASKPATKFVAQRPAPKPVVVEEPEESQPWADEESEDTFQNEEAPF